MGGGDLPAGTVVAWVETWSAEATGAVAGAGSAGFVGVAAEASVLVGG